MESYAYSLAQNGVTGNLLRLRYKKSPELYYSLVEMCELMNTAREESSLIGSCYLWLEELDLVITEDGSYTFEEFHAKLTNEDMLCDSDSFRKHNQPPEWSRYLAIPRKDGSPLLIYQLCVMTRYTGWMRSAVLGVLLNPDTISLTVKQADWLDTESIAILDSQGSCLYASSDATRARAAAYASLGIDGYREIELAGERCYIAEPLSLQNGWRCVSITPTSRVLLPYYDMLRLSCVLLTVSLFIALGLSFITARRQYEPLGRMVSVLGGTPSAANEYHFVESAISDIVNERDHLRTIIDTRLAYLRTSGLIWMLTEETGDPDETRGVMAECGIELPYNGLYVIIASTCDNGRTVGADGQRYLGEILDRALSDYGIVRYVFRIRGRVVALVCVEVGGVSADELSAACRNAISIVRERLRHDLLIAISEEGNGIRSLPSLYSHALDIIEYQEFLRNKGSVLSYTDESVSQFASPEILNAANESALRKKLYNLLLAGKTAEARAEYEELCSRLLNAGPMPLSMLRYRLYKLLDSMTLLLRDLLKGDSPSVEEAILPAAQWLERNDVSGPQEMLWELFDRIALCAEEKRAERENSVITAALSAIRELYASPELSVQMICERIGVSQSTLSKEFKQHMRQGVLDYIHTYRLFAAKELMKTGDYGIQDIASMTGYTSSVSFIRVFKKYEGVTPGAFRKTQTE